VDVITIATGMASVRLTAARAVPARAWWRARSRVAMRTATGRRAANRAAARRANGETRRTPAAVAIVPPISSTGFVPARPRPTKPTASNPAATVVDRWMGWGLGGRPERASVTGTRATTRAGHHAAAVAARTVSPMGATTVHQG
jgi:hypothetical protein